MVDQLRQFAQEVTKIARAVGTDGELGGQATVIGVEGTWKDLTENGWFALTDENSSTPSQKQKALMYPNSQYDGHESNDASARDSFGYDGNQQG